MVWARSHPHTHACNGPQVLAEGDPDAPDAGKNNADIGAPVLEQLDDIEEEDDDDDQDEDQPLPTISPRDK